MSLVESYHAAHKARLSRMGAPSPYQAPIVSIEKAPIKPQPFNAGWEGMWFFDLLQEVGEPRPIVPIKEIQDAVCRYYGITMLDLTSDRRSRDATHPRHVAMYLSRLLTPHSYAEIGRRFGGRDHSTALHGSRNIERQLREGAGNIVHSIKVLRKVLA